MPHPGAAIVTARPWKPAQVHGWFLNAGLHLRETKRFRIVRSWRLRSESRARLADLLVESLDADELGRIDRLWVAAAKRRRDDVRAGRVKMVPGLEARRKVRDALRR